MAPAPQPSDADDAERGSSARRGRVVDDLEAVGAGQHEREATLGLLVAAHEREQLGAGRASPGTATGSPRSATTPCMPIDDVGADALERGARCAANTSPIATASPWCRS